MFCIWVNLFHSWLNRRQLDSYIGFIQSLQYHMSCRLWETPLYTHERWMVKCQIMSVLLWV